MAIAKYKDHTIEATNMAWAEIVKYDGKVVRRGFTLLGRRSYQFVVEEDSQQVTYDVQFRSGLLQVPVKITRNGVEIYDSARNEQLVW